MDLFRESSARRFFEMDLFRESVVTGAMFTGSGIGFFRESVCREVFEMDFFWDSVFSALMLESMDFFRELVV